MAARVIYRWRVHGQRTEFEAAWKELTLSMSNGVPGAGGSVLTWSAEQPDLAVAIANWRSVDDWKGRERFDPNPDASARLESLAVLESVEVLILNEHFDLTTQDAGPLF